MVRISDGEWKTTGVRQRKSRREREGERERKRERERLWCHLCYHTSQALDDSWSCLPLSGGASVTFAECINSWGAAKGKQQCGFVYYSPTWAAASINEEQSAKSRSDRSARSDFHSANNRLGTYALFHQPAWVAHIYAHPLLPPETN